MSYLLLRGQVDHKTELSTSIVGSIVKLENVLGGMGKEEKQVELLLEQYQRDLEQSKQEYQKRVEELKQFLKRQEELAKNVVVRYPIDFVEGNYDRERFCEITKGMETLPEGGERCFACYQLRLQEAAEYAVKGNYDYYTTTLSISPHKNAQKLNEIGEQIGKEYGISWLPSDFKKKNGYRRSCELSEQFGLYRQNYCGCIFSKRNEK